MTSGKIPDIQIATVAEENTVFLSSITAYAPTANFGIVILLFGLF
jgi:hypothetical protein